MCSSGLNRMSRKPQKEVGIINPFHLFGKSLEVFLKDITSQIALLVLSNEKCNWLIWGCLVTVWWMVWCLIRMASWTGHKFGWLTSLTKTIVCTFWLFSGSDKWKITYLECHLESNFYLIERNFRHGFLEATRSMSSKTKARGEPPRPSFCSFSFYCLLRFLSKLRQVKYQVSA